ALTQLGYTSREAEHAVHSVPADTEQTTEALVRAALRELARVVT
ncbi:MAG: Holliday junction branch migration protein RuvA, partial [Candidatus Andersenbacteria bacterium]|nr:Holliday junction branch migration protein RuvA [Candidatus Andersenbacteria bacterium]